MPSAKDRSRTKDSSSPSDDIFPGYTFTPAAVCSNYCGLGDYVSFEDLGITPVILGELSEEQMKAEEAKKLLIMEIEAFINGIKNGSVPGEYGEF